MKSGDDSIENVERSISSEQESRTKNIDKETDLCEEKVLSESYGRSVEEDNNVTDDNDRVNSWLQLYGKLFMRQQCSEQEQCNGLLRKSNVEFEEPNLMKAKKSKLKNEFKNYFDTPIDSLIAFLPYSFWDNHLKETNWMALG